MPSSRSQAPPPGSASPHVRVVAIGASAGGLEALTAILRDLPTDLNMAFVLIQHLDPKRHSILPELIAKATRIPVLEAKHSMRLEPNRVYVMPSNVDISLVDGHFGLLPRSTGLKLHLPINNFMRSLAEVHKSQSIGVILSGTATDGTDGARAIREAGGVTFAQDPSTAKFSGMPQNAIDSGCIDFILTPQNIAAELVRMARHPKLRKKAAMKPVKQNLIRVSALPSIELPPVSRTKQSEAQMQQAADHIVLKEHAPPGVIVNEAMDILQFRGRTSPYLEPASGRANLNLLNMVREDLSIPLRSALATARKKAAEVKKKDIAFEHNGKKRKVNLSVIPLDELSAGTQRNYLILFEDATPAITKQDKKTRSLPLKPGDLPRKRLLDQKSGLQAARALLKEHLAAQEALWKDYKSANEELLSANEELQSSNEEMETSKEELESANEELTTVNDELNNSNSALHVLGNDLKNLLDSTVIPIVMVDSGLCIRRMTPMAEKVFNVLPSDIGRPLTDIRPDFDIELKPLLTAALRDIVTLEREVQDQQGHWYRLQIRPYKTLDNRIDGAVLVLVDIHAMKGRNQVLVDAAEFTTSIIGTMPEPVLVLDAELRVLMANESYYRTFTVAPETTLDQFVYRLGDGQWDTSDLRMLLEEVLPQHKEFTNHELVHNFAGIGVRSFALSGRYMEQGPNTAPLILLALADVTQRKKTELALIQAEKLAIASRLAASVAHEINNPLEAITNLLFLATTSDNAAAVKLFIDQALDELGRVAHITQQTLKFYRQSTSPTSVQLFELLDSLLALYHGKLLANNIKVRRDYRDAPPILCLDGDLRQIFANIIANAIDAMKFGGSLVIRVSASPDWRNQVKPGVRITIADSGIGMDMETRRRMYEPFFTTKNGTGTGLGMWVSAQLIERLQGDLRVWSTPSPGRSGTAFSLFLPLAASQ